MKINWLIVLLVVLMGISLFPKKVPEIKPVNSFNTDFAYDSRTFLPSVAQKYSLVTPSPSVAILPHHLLASNLIARVISSLSRDTKTIIIISPNHANIGQCDIISSENSWNTPYGQIDVDKNILNSFTLSQTVCLDDKNISVEHGIAGLLPFIKYYLPKAQVVNFALKKDISPILIGQFVQRLGNYPNNVVVLASLDFSHGLNQTDSKKNDSVTKDLIQKFDYPGIEKLSSEYLDSPFTLISALEVMKSRNRIPQLISHSDSSEYNGDTHSVTSYFLITDQDKPETKQDNTYSLLFGGDVMLGRSVNTRINKMHDPLWPFRKISDILSSADLTIVNLEAPFGSDCQLTDSGMVFCADAHSVEGLTFSGIDIVNLANNHISNMGKAGFDFTKKLLSSNGIDYIGTGTPVIKNIKNIKIAFLGFDDIAPVYPGVSSASEDNLKNQISSAKKNSDLVIAIFHWGNEYSRHSSRQEKLAHLAIDSGADIIVGHHPHWVQEIESYQGKPIYYSLGNLVFDQMWSAETEKGLLIKLTFSGKNLLKEEKIPVVIKDYGQPQPQ